MERLRDYMVKERSLYEACLPAITKVPDLQAMTSQPPAESYQLTAADAT